MKYSDNYGFSLPNKADKDNADIDVICENFVEIDKLLKDNEAAMEELGATIDTMSSHLTPAVTASDDGKFLRVIGGTWQAVSLTDVSVEGA